MPNVPVLTENPKVHQKTAQHHPIKSVNLGSLGQNEAGANIHKCPEGQRFYEDKTLAGQASPSRHRFTYVPPPPYSPPNQPPSRPHSHSTLHRGACCGYAGRTQLCVTPAHQLDQLCDCEYGCHQSTTQTELIQRAGMVHAAGRTMVKMTYGGGGPASPSPPPVLSRVLTLSN